jgi:hypothetical protein
VGGHRKVTSECAEMLWGLESEGQRPPSPELLPRLTRTALRVRCGGRAREGHQRVCKDAQWLPRAGSTIHVEWGLTGNPKHRPGSCSSQRHDQSGRFLEFDCA